jgi:hypothetical protein
MEKTMVEIIHLAPGQRAPKGELIIECKRGLRSEELIDAPRWITWRIGPERLDNVIKMLARKGAKTIYVRGAPGAQL